MKQKKAMAKTFAICLSAVLIGGNAVSAIAAATDPVIAVETNGEQAPDAATPKENYFTFTGEFVIEEGGVFSTNSATYLPMSANYIDKTTYSVTLPEVTAADGYELAEWDVTSTDNKHVEITWENTNTFLVKGNLSEGSVNAKVTATAKFAKKAEQVKKATLNFNVDLSKGYFVESAGSDTLTKVLDNANVVYELPEVKANEDYVFTGWKVDGAVNKTLPAETNKIIPSEIAYFGDGEPMGYATITPQFAKKPAVVEKFVNANFNSGDYGYFAEGETTITSKVLENAECTIPAVTAKDGYKFTGWKVEGNTTTTLPAGTTTFVPGQYAFFYQGLGNVTLTAQYEKEEVVVKPVNVYFSIFNKDAGVFTGNEETGMLSYENVMEDKIDIPAVTVKEGYIFKGWKVIGSTELQFDPEASEIGGLRDIANFLDGVGYLSVEALFEKAPVEEKTVNVYFSLNKDMGYFADNEEAETDTYKNITADKLDIPKVIAKDGYVFKGWKGFGKDEIILDENAYELAGLKDLANFAGESNNGDISLQAVFEEVPAEERTVEVTFSLDHNKGYFTDPEGADVVSFKGIAEDSAEQFLVPKVAAKDGYVFKGWKGQGADEISWGADAETFGITGLAHFAEGSNVGYATLEAVFEEVPAEERTVEVTFSLDHNKGYFTDPEGADVVSFKGIAEDSAEQFLVPKVAAKDGYVFKGWKGQGADAINWGADAETFGVTGLAHFAEGSNVGYATLEAVFEEVPAEERTVNVYFNVDPEKGYFTDPEGAEVVSFENLPEFTADQFLAPKVAAKDGYVFTGWKGQGADEINWSADAETFGITGLAHFPEGSTVGYATLEAQFERVEAVKAASADIVIDLEKGYFTEWTGENATDTLSFDNIQEADYGISEMPAVTANDGYVFTGWEVTNGAGEVIYTLDAATASILFPVNVADHYTVKAVFETVPPQTESESESESQTESEPESESESESQTESESESQTESESESQTESESESQTESESETKKPESETKKPEKLDGVKTGDETNTGALAVTLFGSAFVITGIALKKYLFK